MPGPTYADLCDAMDAAGVEVRVGVEGGRLVLRLVDHHRLRWLERPVRSCVDREASVICCSLALCAELGGPLDPGRARARDWPELTALAHAWRDRAGADDPSA